MIARMPSRPRLRPSTLDEWPVPFDPRFELDWGRPDYGRRLLREHLDQRHEGASRTTRTIDQQVRRLRALLPRPPASVLDAGCGPGLYAVRLAAAGYDVTGVDVNPAAVRYARQHIPAELRDRLRYERTELSALRAPRAKADAAILIYYVLEGFPARTQPRVLRRIAASMHAGGTLIAELRLRPDQLPGRLSWWQVVSESLLADRRHLLMGDSTYDQRRHTYVLREVAVFDDGGVASQQTTSWLCPWDRIAGLFTRGGFAVDTVYDGWTAERGSALSETLLVVARRLP